MFKDPVGQTMLMSGLTLLLVGLVVSKRMVTIRV
jgi:Flp pilus assembly protein TadB